MSDRELTPLRGMIVLTDGRLTVEAASTLMNLGWRLVFRLLLGTLIDIGDLIERQRQSQPETC